ncbi:chaperone modulator CbpM [Undibacterium sp. Ji50W]|uniref:chaperone modulator CbpM n=1 Tax=Undibacterium sp. Ji50W TaxID=3413041 RepID=UPI003BEF697E
MKVQISEWVLLNEQNACSVSYLSEVSGLSAEELSDLIENGILVPIDGKATEKFFPLHSIVIASSARRLRDDFELDRHGMMLALTLMRRIDDLQGELNVLRARFQ